jgi:hypothetical protein
MARWADLLCRCLAVDGASIFSSLHVTLSVVPYRLTMECELTCMHSPRHWCESGEYGALSTPKNEQIGKERMLLITIRNDRCGDGASNNRYVSFYIWSWQFKKLTAQQDLFFSPHRSPPIARPTSRPVSPHLCTLQPVMLDAQIQCRGCGRLFVPRGLSVHVNKSRDPRCRSALRTSRVPAATSSSIQRPTTPPPLNQNEAVTEDPISEDGEYRGHAYGTEGTFTIRRGAFSRKWILHIITDNTGDLNRMSIEPPGPADLEDLGLTDDETPVERLPQTEVGDQADASDSESASTVIVEHFPFGEPGAPVPGRAQGPSAFDSQEAGFTDSPWAPFRSQLDWDVACWAKLRGPTSTALSELLAIPGVCASILVSVPHL